jgi:hypothetical protein
MDATSLEVRLENILRGRDGGRRKIVAVIFERNQNDSHSGIP